MAIANPVYYNAALAAYYRACLPPGSNAVNGFTGAQMTTGGGLFGSGFGPAAIAFATEVDSVIQSVNATALAAQAGGNAAWDSGVSSAAGVTAVGVSAFVKNAQATRPILVGDLCYSFLVSAGANNGLQGGAGSAGGGLSPAPAHTPVPGDYLALATNVAQAFAGYISVAGGESIV